MGTLVVSEVLPPATVVGSLVDGRGTGKVSDGAGSLGDMTKDCHVQPRRTKD